MTDWKGYVAAGLTVLGLLFQGARWVGQMEARLDQLEYRARFFHGEPTASEER
jgi:hypothetical protein